MASSFREVLKSDRFVITSEIGPPKGTNIEKMLHHIDLLKDKVDALNVTDHQSSVMRFPSIGGCLAIKEKGGEPILQVTCRDRNRLALQAELLFAYTRGIRNVLCLNWRCCCSWRPQGGQGRFRPGFSTVAEDNSADGSGQRPGR